MVKTSSAVLFVLGIIAVLGDVVLMYILFETGRYLSLFVSTDPSVIPNAGVPIAETQALARQILTYVNIGWVWAISVLVVSIATVFYSAQDLLKKAKKK